MRAFVAIEISEDVRAALDRVRQELARTPAQVKWVAPANVHLTLKFLGEIETETAEAAKGAMGAAAGGGPFTFEVAGLGSFPPGRKPRVVWAGVIGGADAIARVQTKLDAALGSLGFARERDFVPHLTIGRVKSPRGADALAAAIARHADTAFGSSVASEMVLFESTLTPQGAVYRAVARVPL